MKAVRVINTKNDEVYNYQSIAHAKNAIIPLSARTGYTFKVIDTNTGELVGKIRPNPRQYVTKTNPKGKLTARFIRND